MGRGRKMRRGRIDGQGLGGRGRIIGRCSAKGRSTVGGEGPEGQVAHGPEREIGERRMKGGTGRDPRTERVVGEENGTCARVGWSRMPMTDGKVAVAVGGAGTMGVVEEIAGQ